MTIDATTDYPQLFRQMVVRSTQAALAAIDPKAAELKENERERSLYALGLALDLPDAWLVTQELLVTVSPQMIWQGYHNEWMAFLAKGMAAAEEQADLSALAKLHVQTGRTYRRLNRFEQAKEHSLRAYDLSRRQNDKDTEIDALDQLSAVAVETSDFAAAEMYADAMARLADADDSRHAFRCSRLGYMAAQQSEWDKSIYWHSESVRLHTAAGRHHFAAQSERFLGWAYMYSKQYQQAIAHFRHVLEILSQHPNLLETAMTQMGLGVAYWYLEDYEQSLAMYRLCEPTFVNSESKVSLSHLYNNYGLAYMRLGSFEQAECSFSLSIEIARELNMPYLVANALESLGGMYEKMGMSNQAIATWGQALQELSGLSQPPSYLHNLILRRIQEVSAPGGPGAGPPESPI